MAKRKPIILLSSKPYIVSFLSDYGFKVTFADRNNTLFARKAIEFILGDNQPILTLKHLRNEFEGLSEEARSGLYDVLCKDEHKRVFIVEMQLENYDFILERLQFYGFHIFNSLVRKGKEGFKNLSPVHCICIIKGVVTDSEKYHQIINLRNEDNEIIMDNPVFHLIELGKFPIGKNELSKITTEKEELLYTMKYAHKFDPSKDVLPPFWEKDFYQVPLKRLDTSKMSPLEAAAYENALMRHRIVVEYNEKKFKEALQREVAIAVEKEVAIAVEKEVAIAVEKEVAIAVQQEAEKAKIEAVKKGLQMGLGTIPQIAEMLGVSIDFVKQVELSLEDSDKPIPKKHSKKSKPN